MIISKLENCISAFHFSFFFATFISETVELFPFSYCSFAFLLYAFRDDIFFLLDASKPKYIYFLKNRSKIENLIVKCHPSFIYDTPEYNIETKQLQLQCHCHCHFISFVFFLCFITKHYNRMKFNKVVREMCLED